MKFLLKQYLSQINITSFYPKQHHQKYLNSKVRECESEPSYHNNFQFQMLIIWFDSN
jgi:hypothetical protein